MNEEKLRIALAKALGWRVLNLKDAAEQGLYKSADPELWKWDALYSPENKKLGSTGYGQGWARWVGSLPNYPTSRDAAIAAVIELCDDDRKRTAFENELLQILQRPSTLNPPRRMEFLSATPLQICTALAKALNLPINQEDEE